MRMRGGPPRLAGRRVLAGDGGFVTAEAAVVLPVLVAFAMALVWGLLVVSAQIRCVDAARAGARAAARQDPADAVLAVTRATAPRGSDVTVDREGGQVRVVVVAKPPALRGLPFEVREEAVAAAEEAPAAAGDDPGAATSATGGPNPGPSLNGAPGVNASPGVDTGPGANAGPGAGERAGP
ncbi:TadE family type IV pilus minor pilin [Streptomyces sp. NPDC021608]|uniref:TadE family type IV pilus minor pilin n=1 Tax=Streptomyces sp. NPDC021608 TaxID=3154903 RepID=UPI0033F772E5